MLTVLLTTNLTERFPQARKRIRALQAQGFKGEILVGVWGGHDHIDALTRDVAGQGGSIRILAQDGQQSLFERKRFLAEQAQHEFMAWQADDDFLCLAGLQAAATLLAHQPDLAAVGGRRLILVSEPPMAKFKAKPLATWSVPDATPFARLARIANHVGGASYSALMRRPTMIRRMALAAEMMQRTGNFAFAEHIAELSTYLLGAFVASPIFYQFCVALPDRYAAKWANSPKYAPEMILSPDFSADCAVFQAMVAAVLAELGENLADMAAQARFRTVLTNYVKGIIGAQRADMDDAEIQFRNGKRPGLDPLVTIIQGALSSP